MSKKMMYPMSLLAIGILFVLPSHLHAETKPPTVVFYAAYVFEAQANGDTLEFPLMPGETSIKTLEAFSETAQGYIERLRSIYSYQHIIVSSVLGGSFTIDLSRRDGRHEQFAVFGQRNHLLAFSVSCMGGPEEGFLPLMIEVDLDTLTRPDQIIPSKNRITLFKTKCSVKYGHPLVIGRPLASGGYRRQAVFIVFTPFFHRIERGDQYSRIIADYRKVYSLLMGRNHFGGQGFIESLNDYFETHLRKQNTLEYEAVIGSLPPPPPPPLREDLPRFMPHDKAPEPVGGFAALSEALDYPESAQKSQIEGNVLVWVQIDENGVVKRTRIARSLDPSGCDDAAVNAITSVRWNPAYLRGRPVAVWVAIPIQFKLK